MKRAFLFLATTLFCFALQAQDTDDSLAYLLGEPEPTLEAEQTTDVEDIQVDDITAEDFDEEEEAEEEVEYKVLVAPDALPGTIEYKTQKFSVRKFDEEKWKSIAGSANYEEKPKKIKDAKKKDLFRFESIPWSGEVLRAVSYVLIIVIVLALLYYLLKNTTFETKLKKRSFEVKDFVSRVENIEDLDIQALLQKTLAEGDLRLAIRLYYLGLLKKLNYVGFITWKRDKTNRDYLSELFQKEDYFEDVRKLTLAYEQVWYGEHTIASESFKILSSRFEFLDQKLNSLKPL